MSGDTTLIAVIVIRTLVPFTILRWPLGGALLAILGDISDVMLFEAFGSGPLTGKYYHNLDKFFDTYYLAFEFVASRRWSDALARKTSAVLFFWRFAGFLVFEVTTFLGAPFRPAFFFAPNIFEHFYLFTVIARKFFKSFTYTPKSLIIILLIVGLPKVAQEWFMHYAFPDQTWHFFRDHVFWWLYRR